MTGSARTWRLDLPYATPPLSLNGREHWRTRARITSHLRYAVNWWADKAVPEVGVCAVTLHYAPRDARRRDADNLVPILKACCDGLVDARIVPDDTPEYMTKHMPVIDPPDRDRNRTSRLYLIVTEGL